MPEAAFKQGCDWCGATTAEASPLAGTALAAFQAASHARHPLVLFCAFELNVA